MGIFEPGRKESLLFPLDVSNGRDDDVPEDREAERSEPCLGCFDDSSPLPFPFAALAFVASFNFRDDDADDELADVLVLVDASLDERDDLDDEFALFDAPFDERDDLEDELPELLELVSVVTLSVFGSVVEVCAATSALSWPAAAAALAAANKGLAGRSLCSSNNESAPRDSLSLS